MPVPVRVSIRAARGREKQSKMRPGVPRQGFQRPSLAPAVNRVIMNEDLKNGRQHITSFTDSD